MMGNNKKGTNQFITDVKIGERPAPQWRQAVGSYISDFLKHKDQLILFNISKLNIFKVFIFSWN